MPRQRRRSVGRWAGELVSPRRVAAIRVALAVLLGMLVALVAWQHYQLTRAEAKLLSLRAGAQVSLSDGTVRAAELTTAVGGAEQMAEQLGVSLDKIRSDAAALGADLNSLVAATVRTTGAKRSGLASSEAQARQESPSRQQSVEAPEGVDLWKYTSSRQVLKLSEPFAGGIEVPWGKTGFSAWKREPWDVEILPRGYRAFSVGSVGEDGKRRVYTQFAIEVDGQVYKLPVTEATYVEDEAPASFRWCLKPLLALSVGPFISGEDGVAVLPGVDLAVATYGYPGEPALWVFLAPGVRYEPRVGSFALSAVPVAFNVGKPMPLLENLYLGPSVAVQGGGGVSVGVSLQVGL